jgi:hypothetical protein
LGEFHRHLTARGEEVSYNSARQPQRNRPRQ